MAPRRKENVNQESGESQPNQEETQILEPEQTVGGKPGKESDVYVAGIPAAYAQISNQLVEELTAIKIEEISQTMSKVMVDSMSKMVADCLKTLLSKPSQSVQEGNNITEKEGNQESLQSIELEQGVGNSRAGDSRRPEFTLPNQQEVRYTPPHKRDETLGWRVRSFSRIDGVGGSKQPVNQVYAVTNPLYQPGMYDDTAYVNGQAVDGVFPGESNNTGFQTRGANYYHHPLPARNIHIDPEMVRETIQELYGPALRQIGRPEFHKPYPEYVDINNPYPRGYRVHDFSLFSGEDNQSSLEHIARFTIQCGELANLENSNNLKLRLFPNSLTGTAFAWYAALPRNSVMNWQEMERQFHTQFYRTEPEVCIADLSRMSQKKGESVEMFVDRFKKMKNRCKVFLPETEFVKMAQKGLDFELRKKFQGMEFRDFFELAAKVAEYEELLREESYKKKTMMGSYYQEVEEIALAEIRSSGSCTVPLLKRKPMESEKNINVQPFKDMQYTFDISKTDEIFDYLVKEKFITFPPDHRMPVNEEFKGREYCKYHNSFNHSTKSCWAFKNVLQERINKGVLKFPEKQESMAVDNDPFPPAASINMNVTDLRDLLNKRRGKAPVRPEKNVKSCWIPRGQIYEASRRCDDRRYYRGVGSSTAFGPKNQQFYRTPIISSRWFRGESSYQRYSGNKDLSGIESKNVELKNKSGDHKRNQHVSRASVGKAVENEAVRSRFVLPPRKDFDGIWRVAQHRKFPRPLTRTQKRRLLRERAAAKGGEIVKMDNEPMFHVPANESQTGSRSKFNRSATEDKLVDEDDDLLSDESDQGRKTIDFCVGKFHISVDCATGLVILPEKFKCIEEEDCKELVLEMSVRGVNDSNKVLEGSSGAIIKEEYPSKPTRVILEKPTPAMTKNIIPMYIKAHVNGKPVSRVLIDNGSAVSVIPVRMLQSLGKTKEDLIPIEVFVSSFTGETTKTIGVLPADVTVETMSSLCAFFVVDSPANFQELLGGDWIHANQCFPRSMHQQLLFWKEDEVEIVEANTQPFQTSEIAFEARYCNGDFESIKIHSQSKNINPVDMQTPTPSSVLEKILKPNFIVPFRPIIQSLIDELDD